MEKILFTSIETASLIHSFLKEEGNVLAYPFVEDYQVLDAMIDPDNDGLVKVRIVYKKEKPELLTLANNGPTNRFLLSQIPATQVERHAVTFDFCLHWFVAFVCTEVRNIKVLGSQNISGESGIGREQSKWG